MARRACRSRRSSASFCSAIRSSSAWKSARPSEVRARPLASLLDPVHQAGLAGRDRLDPPVDPGLDAVPPVRLLRHGQIGHAIVPPQGDGLVANARERRPGRSDRGGRLERVDQLGRLPERQVLGPLDAEVAEQPVEVGMLPARRSSGSPGPGSPSPACGRGIGRPAGGRCGHCRWHGHSPGSMGRRRAGGSAAPRPAPAGGPARRGRPGGRRHRRRGPGRGSRPGRARAGRGRSPARGGTRRRPSRSPAGRPCAMTPTFSFRATMQSSFGLTIGHGRRVHADGGAPGISRRRRPAGAGGAT